MYSSGSVAEYFAYATSLALYRLLEAPKRAWKYSTGLSPAVQQAVEIVFFIRLRYGSFRGSLMTPKHTARAQ